MKKTLATVSLAALILPGVAIATNAACPELTLAQKGVGYLTWMNVLLVFAACIGTTSIYIIFKERIIKKIPIVAYEIILYLISFAVIAAGVLASGKLPVEVPLQAVKEILPSATNAESTAFIGSLLFCVAMLFTATVRKVKENTVGFFLTLFFVYAVVACTIGSSMIGFIAVMALMGALGFSAMVIPMGFAVGFTDSDSLSRATTAGIVMLIVYVLQFLGIISLNVLEVFQAGALWMGSIVGFIGLMIHSSKYYESKNWGLRQLAPITAGIAAVVVGGQFGIQPLMGIGISFLGLYFIERIFEIAAKSIVSFAVVGIFVSTIIVGLIFLAKDHPQWVETYTIF